MTIIIDLDDVICDCGVLHIVNKFLNTNYKIDDIENYYVQDLVPKDRMDQFNDFFFENSMYDLVNINDNAYEVLEYLNSNHSIYICSAYILKDDIKRSGLLANYKHDFLYNTFPFINPNHYIFTSSKAIVNGDVRIDDKIDNLSGDAKLKLLYTAYHNKNISLDELSRLGIIRVDNWLAIKKVIDEYSNIM